MLEELLGELSGSIPELGAVSIPEFTMPGGSLPQFSLPFDPAELEACFGDLQLGE